MDPKAVLSRSGASVTRSACLGFVGVAAPHKRRELVGPAGTEQRHRECRGSGLWKVLSGGLA